MEELLVDVEADRDRLVAELKACNKGLDVWQNSRAYVLGFREQQLTYFYAHRSRVLDKLKAYQR